jgi:5-methylcytosine-specific restriction enzyme A
MLPDRVRLRIFRSHNETCHLSGRKIGPGEKWELEHIKALILGGEHRESNLAPALMGPHKRKTAMEMAVKAKIDGSSKRHYGIKKSKNPMPGSKASGWKKRFDGTVERRS